MKIVNPIALVHAKKVNDKNVTNIDRAISAVALYNIVSDGKLYVDVPDDFNIRVRTDDVAEALVDNKPVKYIWRNGARIKVNV